MNATTTCARTRIGFIAAGVSLWAFSITADITCWMGWAGPIAKTLAFYATVAGIAMMLIAAFICGYDLGSLTDAGPAKAELLDSGVILAAALLFVLAAVLRNRLGDSVLPMALSALGLAGVLAELWLDITDSDFRFQKRFQRKRPL